MIQWTSKTFKSSNNEIFTTNPYLMTFDEYCISKANQFIETNDAINKLNRIEKLKLRKFIERSFPDEIKNSILSGQPVKNLEFDKIILQISRIDWLKVIKEECCQNKNLKNETEVRAYLAKYFMFYSVKGLTKKERLLNNTVREYLVKGLKKDIRSRQYDERIKSSARRILHEIDFSQNKMDSTGEAIIILASANFIKNGTLEINFKSNKDSFMYPEYDSQIKEKVWGKDEETESVESYKHNVLVQV